MRDKRKVTDLEQGTRWQSQFARRSGNILLRTFVMGSVPEFIKPCTFEFTKPYGTKQFVWTVPIDSAVNSTIYTPRCGT
jgi:hypothetical protein